MSEIPWYWLILAGLSGYFIAALTSAAHCRDCAFDRHEQALQGDITRDEEHY